MSRRLELAEERVVIEFPYDRKMVELVRSLPGRRFNPTEKTWSVPSQHMEQVVGRLVPHGFELGEELTFALIEMGVVIEELARDVARAHKPFLDEERLPAGTWTVAKLNHEVQQVLRGAFREELWIAAEIQSFDRNRSRGHAFFELVHRPFQGADPSARVTAVMWSDDREHIEQTLADDGGGVRLRDGLMVRFLAQPDFYTGQGRYQLNVSDIDLAYTSGTIHQNREAILRALNEEGLVDLNASKPLVDVPLRVALITSDESDAYADFVDELRLSGYGFQVGFFAAHVQGAHAEESILKALRYFEKHADEYDVLAIVRGGGARSDLAYFDTRAIGESVCKHPLKVVVGIGHQRDQCLIDFLAQSEKTPTAAADAIVEQVEYYLERQYSLQDRVLREAEHIIKEEGIRLEQQVERALRVMTHELEHVERKVDRVAGQVARATRVRLEQEHLGVERVWQKIEQSALSSARMARFKQAYLQERLSQVPGSHTIKRQSRELERYQERLLRVSKASIKTASVKVDRAAERQRLLDPRRVLERGFALIRNAKDDTVIRSAEDTSTNQELVIKWSDGEKKVKVQKT